MIQAWIRGFLGMICLMGVAGAWAGEEITIDGVVHVKNGATPSEGIETLEFEELWRVGGADDEENVFGVIVQAITDDENKIYLLDMQLSQVMIFSPEGEMIGTLSREGEGPGEVRRPSDMLIMPDGSLGIVQTFPGKIIKVTLDNEPAGQLVVGGNNPTQGGISAIVDGNCAGGNLVLAGVQIAQEQTGQTRMSYLSSFADDGAEKVRYWEKTSRLDFTNLQIIEKDQYALFPRRWNLATDGRIYAATERNQYLISVFAPDGTLLRVIERDSPPHKRTDEEIATLNERYAAQLQGAPNVTIEIEEYAEAIQSIDVAPDGNIWVTSATSTVDQPDGIFMTFDIFNPAGHFIKQLQVVCEADGQDDALILAGPGRYLLIKGLMPAIAGMQGASGSDDEEAEPMEIIYLNGKTSS